MSIEAMKQIGGFDPIFFMYAEDTDFCRRARAKGWRIGLAPDVHAFHWHGGPDRERKRQSVEWIANWRLYHDIVEIKSRSPFARAVLWWIRYSVLQITAMAAEFHWRECWGTLKGKWRLLRRLPRIRRSYQLSRSNGQWI